MCSVQARLVRERHSSASAVGEEADDRNSADGCLCFQAFNLAKSTFPVKVPFAAALQQLPECYEYLVISPVAPAERPSQKLWCQQQELQVMHKQV